MTTTPVASKVPVIADSRGRVRTSKEQRRAILAEFERSGVSASGFAQRTGLKYSTLAGWLQRHRRTKLLKRTPPLRLLEAVVDASPGTAVGMPLVLQLPGGIRLELTQASQASLIVSLIRALEKSC